MAGKGISATLAHSGSSRRAAGWFGKVVQDHGFGTSNIGIGGKDGAAASDATNVVTDYALSLGQARSPELKFAAEIVDGYDAAFAKAQAEVTDDAGEQAKVEFRRAVSYPPFKLAKDAPSSAVQRVRWKPWASSPTTCSRTAASTELARSAASRRSPSPQARRRLHRQGIREPAGFADGCRIAVLMATLDD